MKNILIPIDGSEFSKRAIEKGKEIAKVYNSNIILLNVVNNLTPNLTLDESMEVLKMMTVKSEELLNEAKKNFDDTYKVELVSLEGNVPSAIADYADSNDVDLVIMGSQGLNAGRIKGIFVGSTTNKVIHITKRPILVIK